MCDVSGEVSIFVAFLSVSCVNVPLSWTGEFIQVDYFLVVVNDHNVWLLCSHTELRLSCETTTIQCNFANAQDMVCGLSTFAQFAEI